MRALMSLVSLFVMSATSAFAADATTRAIRIPQTQPVAREQWGAPLVDVKRDEGDTWTIAGKKQTVTLNARDLSMQIVAGPAKWAIVGSARGDLIARSGKSDRTLRLADAKHIDVEPYDTGYETGVKLTLSGWPEAESLKLYLT